MRKKPNRPDPEKQAQLTRSEQKRAQRAFERDLRQWEKDRATFQRQIDRQYQRELDRLEKLGAYQPTSHELTPSRKKRIRAKVREYHEFISGDYAFVSLPTKASVKQAKGLHFKTTKKGLFIEREGYKRFKVAVDKKTGEVYIDRFGKEQRGPSGGRRKTSSRIPLTAADILTREKDRLRREAEKLGPLKGKQRLAFVLTIRDQYGYSRTVYADIEKLLEDLDKYEKRVHWLAQIFRHIEIQKTESAQDWFREHPTRPPTFRRMKVKGYRRKKGG